MPSSSFQKSSFTNAAAMRRRARNTSKRYINGVLVAPSGKEFMAQNGTQILKSGGYTDNSPATPEKMLGILGISTVNNLSREYTFLKTENLMTSTNPNIIDEEAFKQLTNKKIPTSTYFKNAKNPFFNISEETVSRSRQREIKHQTQIKYYTNRSNISNAMLRLNLSSMGGNLGQFQ